MFYPLDSQVVCAINHFDNLHFNTMSHREVSLEIAGAFLNRSLVVRPPFSTPEYSLGAKHPRITLSDSPENDDSVDDACVLTRMKKLPGSGKSRQGRCAYCRDYKTTWTCLKHNLMICQGGGCEPKHMQGLPPVKRERE